jgi:hypothetical protein
MTEWIISAPDGTRYKVTAPEGMSKADVIARVQRQHSRARPSAAAAAPAKAPPAKAENSALGTGAAGGAYGVVGDPLEGMGQFAEFLLHKITGRRMRVAPQFLRDAMKEWRNYGRSTTTGRVAELGGEIGSMFIPLGGLARAAGFAGQASRAAEAGRAGLQGVRSAVEAGPWGYAAVRRAVETPADIGRRAVKEGTTGPGAAKELWTHPRDYFPGPERGPVRPSKARPAFETPNPPSPPIGPPTAAKRARLAASDAASATGKRVGAAAARFPATARLAGGATRGAVAAGLQPVEGTTSDADYWSAKEAQMAAGAAAGAFAASPVARRAAAALGTHAAVHGAGFAVAPHAYWAHWPLHHLARRAGYATGSMAARPIGAAGQRAAGATTGALLKGEPYRGPNLGPLQSQQGDSQ